MSVGKRFAGIEVVLFARILSLSRLSAPVQARTKRSQTIKVEFKKKVTIATGTIKGPVLDQFDSRSNFSTYF